LVKSGLFHVAIFVLAAVGLPWAAHTPDLISTPIDIQIVDVDEITQTDKIAKPVKEPKKELDPPKQTKPAPPKMTAEAPPDLSMPKPPELDPPKEDLPEPELAPPPEKAMPAKVKPPPSKPKPPATKVAKPKPQENFNSLLKNLLDTEEQQPEANDNANGQANGQIARLSDRLSMSELDAVRSQLAQCWNILAGAKFAEDLVVEVRVTINPDRTVQSATILDQGRYNRDSHFRAAADAARRALINPRCSPLNLPPEKYDLWRVTVIRFDPRDIL